MKGLIGLDIDGTIECKEHPIPEEVTDFLKNLSEQDWKIAFITGRTFDSGYPTVKGFKFPYYLAVQNGAIILEMPSMKIIEKCYIDRTILPKAEALCSQHATGFVVYGGFENGNQCFYCPSAFPKELHEYLMARCKAFGEQWVPLKNIEEMPLKKFPSIKTFGRLPLAECMGKLFENELGLHCPVIKDPFCDGYYVSQATDPQVSKGFALKSISIFTKNSGLIIAAGDDFNDITMFKEAHISIAMESAPDLVKEHATIIAPHVSEKGIIQGLKNAIEMGEANRPPA